MKELNTKEIQFESDIEDFLIHHGGYEKGDPKRFDRVLALDTRVFLDFIKTTQRAAWKRQVENYRSEEKAEQQLLKRFQDEVRGQGLLFVLRKGFVDRGVRFRVVYWKPEGTLNPETEALYEANRFSCTRQLHYSPYNENSIDMVLFLNGIPVVSLELKDQFTGQDTENAIHQYRFDRKPEAEIFAFGERVLVHFAVDLSSVYMTTKLAGEKTRFLPFNQGSNGAGRKGGAGNPPNPNGYPNSHLWERVLVKDELLELLHKYMHWEGKKANGGGKMIFPRYHQLDVVEKLLADVERRGAGHNYLIEHSAGSGKSNSIAWLAYRLAELLDRKGETVFRSVVIVSDRRALDKNLQDTVVQFGQVPGMVRQIKRNSKELLSALRDGVPIIITTIQKFPYIYDQVKAENACFAVIVDEAHSSQNGKAARKLKAALGDTEAVLRKAAELDAADETARDETDDPVTAAVKEDMASQGQMRNLSFFAFTATPKRTTLQIFGEQEADGSYVPFHRYSMRQAIEEGFILDVLQNYTTYKTYYKIAKIRNENPEVDTVAGMKAIVAYESLHPYNISQKTKVMLDYFRRVTMHKIGGRAKAMLVTASRLHAVRYALEFERQIKEGNWPIKVLVAFSGEVEDEGSSYTEPKLNEAMTGLSISESQTTETFAQDGYGILIVAEKYQTGFDQPLLQTMFVDKKLSGVKTVQTLSRLNRMAPGKVDTFVLDFVNEAEEIQKDFQPFYEGTWLETETDPNTVYDMRHTLDAYQLYTEEEIQSFAQVYFKNSKQMAGDLGKLKSILQPAEERYQALSQDKKELFASTLAQFNRLYNFITQVCRLFDEEMHKFSVYARFLYKVLPKGERETVDVDGLLSLEYFKMDKTYHGGITLKPAEEGFTGISGQAGRREKKKKPFQELLDQFNTLHGTEFTEQDKVFEQVVNDCVKDEDFSGVQFSDKQEFDTYFQGRFLRLFMDRINENSDFGNMVLSDSDFLKAVRQKIGDAVYNELKKAQMKQGWKAGALRVAESHDGDSR